VVMANAGRENDEPGDLGVAAQERMALPSPGIAVTGPTLQPEVPPTTDTEDHPTAA